MKSIAFIDFDGTISKNDSFPAFIIFTKGYLKFILTSLLFVPQIILSKITNADKGKIKEKWIRFHFKGDNVELLKRSGEEFAEHYFQSGNLREEMLSKIAELKKEGTQCVIVSASPDVWIESFSKILQLEYICTELEFVNGKFSGCFKTQNCKGVQKKIRIMDRFTLSDYSRIIVFGDSADDNEMMAIGTEQHWIR